MRFILIIVVDIFHEATNEKKNRYVNVFCGIVVWVVQHWLNVTFWHLFASVNWIIIDSGND